MSTAKTGRPLSEDGAYARATGIARKTIIRVGGARKLKAMDPEAAALILRGRPK